MGWLMVHPKADALLMCGLLALGIIVLASLLTFLEAW